MGIREWAARAPLAAFGEYVLRADAICRLKGFGQEEKPLAGAVARVESGADFSRRVTVTRLIAIGAFAFAAKKKSGGESYLTIEGPDFFWTLEVDRKKRAAAEKFAGAVNNAARAIAAPVAPVAAAPGGADEVSRLAELHAAGHLSDAEYTAAKAKALGI